MNLYLFGAALLVFIVGIIHSVAGEILFLRHLKDEHLPVLFKRQLLAKRTTRLVWHITTVFAFVIGFALAYISLLVVPDILSNLLVSLIAIAMFLCFLMSFIISRGQHPSWIAFLAIVVLCFLGLL